MTDVQFGIILPTDRLDTAARTTTMAALDHALALVTGHFDSAWSIDHLQSGEAALLEAFTTLAYMAALQPQLRFGYTVLCQSFRNPALLAKMGATLQWLSGGRFISQSNLLGTINLFFHML
jgi:alkanesulfonate monooxygenase SsuD/methylene tetrahydromethanopterin reductase-like flavin-dependent oxidoreductase (luciferase family)